MYLPLMCVLQVDHYVGKVGMRVLSHQLHPSVRVPRRVDVVMTETEHVGGRSKFYDEYGVVRDVMQNHLTLALIQLALSSFYWNYFYD